MRNKLSYNKILISTFCVLVIVLLSLLFLNTFAKLHIRFIEVDGGKDNAEFLDSKIKLYFNTPIERVTGDRPIDFKQFIEITPEINYNLSWNGNTLFIIPKDSLNEDFEYKLLIKPGIQDVYGNVIVDNNEYSFRTKPLEFSYLQKNYPNGKDKIISRNLKTKEEEVIIEEDNITRYSINKNYVVLVVTNPDKTTNIKTMDLKTRGKRNLELKNVNISGLDISTKLDVFIYLSQDVEPQGQILQPKSNIAIKIFNLNNQSTADFKINGVSPDVMTAQFSPDGRSILYRSSESLYYLATIDNSSEQINIGKFTGSGGFNKDGTKILFNNYDPLRTYASFPFITLFNADRTQINITDGSNYVIDPVFLNRSDDVLFSNRYEELLGTQGLFNITKATLETSDTSNYQFSDIINQPNQSVELPKPSWSDRYILTERYTEPALLDYQKQRSFINQRKPYKADLVIFDIENNVIVDEIKGAIDGYWLR